MYLKAASYGRANLQTVQSAGFSGPDGKAAVAFLVGVASDAFEPEDAAILNPPSVCSLRGVFALGASHRFGGLSGDRHSHSAPL